MMPHMHDNAMMMAMQLMTRSEDEYDNVFKYDLNDSEFLGSKSNFISFPNNAVC